MALTFTELEAHARKLPPDERARLAEILLASLEVPPSAEIEAAWHAEIERRVAASNRGESRTHAAEDVFAEARRLLP